MRMKYTERDKYSYIYIAQIKFPFHFYIRLLMLIRSSLFLNDSIYDLYEHAVNKEKTAKYLSYSIFYLRLKYNNTG